MFKFIKNLISPTRTFYGHDLNKWEYLGCRDVTSPGRAYTAIVFFFCSKTSPALSYHAEFPTSVDRGYMLKSHPFFIKNLPAWKNHLLEDYIPIHEPSKFFRAAMYGKNGWVWNTETKWWEPEKKDRNISTEDNIISVDFK